MANAFVSVQDRKRKRERKEDPGEPSSNFHQHVGRLRAENILGDSSAKGSTQPFALGPLHQDHEDHQQGHQDEKPQANIDQDRHWDGEYGRQIAVVE